MLLRGEERRRRLACASRCDSIMMISLPGLPIDRAAVSCDASASPTMMDCFHAFDSLDRAHTCSAR